jgi:trimethylamine--corrinoid protein Co-methyltransferase
MTDSDEVDCQAGYETEQNLMMGMLTGANILNNCLGTLDALMVTSYEKFMIDEELFKRFYRITQGLEVTQESLSLEIIKDVTSGGGNFMSHESTFRSCRNYWRPSVSFRGRHKNILKGGTSEDLVGLANKKYKQTLQACPETIIPQDLDSELKEYMRRKLD